MREKIQEKEKRKMKKLLPKNNKKSKYCFKLIN
jgi:hypothetical protein